MLKIKNISHRFGKQEVIKNLSFQTKDSGLYVFAGTNGCGKSTLYRLICGLCIAQKGSVSLNNNTNSDDYRQHIGISLEPFKTENSLTVHQILNMAQLEKNCTNKEVQYWLKYWELDDARCKMFKELSVGMIKRLSLVIALLGNPTVLILDEPFNGLDPLGIQKLQSLIEEHIEQGKLILLSTHLLSELSNTIEQVLIMEEGQIKKILNKEDISNENKATIIKWLHPQTQTSV